jgi:two-component system, response regulator YesN
MSQMLKILIIDDEELIRDGVAIKLERLMPDVHVIGKAQDAHQALEIIKINVPDIILTDIRMPEIDGLKLIEMVKEEYPGIRFVVISGYQDFEYAKKSISLNVGDYLLKPIDNIELKNIIEKLDFEINQEKQKNEYLLNLKSNANSSTYFLRNKYLTDAIYFAGEFEIDYIKKALEKIQICFPEMYYTVITLIIDNIDCLPGFPGKKDISLAKFAIINIVEESLSSFETVAAFENLKKENQIVAIINHKNSCSSSRLVLECQKLQKSLSSFLKVNATIGIGKSYSDINLLNNSYIESHTAVMQRIVLDNENVIHIDSVPDSSRVTFFMSENERQLLSSYIAARNLNNSLEVLEKIFLSMKSHRTSFATVYIVCFDILIILGKIVKESGISWENIFKDKVISEESILQYTTLEELKSWLKECVTSICSYLSKLNKSDGKKSIEEIKEYVKNYYYTDINLNDLANKYFINSSYLSQLFKNETNEKFVDYVTRIRVEKAMELLSNTSLKTYEIAAMVGYSDPRYFSDVFLKVTGKTPSKYRELDKS